MRNSYFLLCFILLINPLFGQNHSKFGASWCKVKDSPLIINDYVSLALKNNARLIDNNGVILIPVVFHVLYNNTLENIDEGRIISQIQRLNTDFRKLNPEIIPYSPWALLQSDIKVEFKLACIDPQGNYTNGIVRKATTVAQFMTEDEIKFNATNGDNAWSTDTYLNIWVGDFDDASGFLGHATFPEEYNGTTGGIPGNLLDGIVLDYTIVGDNNGHISRNLGRVATHEIGHWLGLKHVFTQVCLQIEPDIPLQSSDYNGQCPSFPVLDDFCNPSYPGVMFMNYMNYTNDPCMYMFSNSQKDKMRSYYSSSSQNPIRFPFLQNYFGIKRFQSTDVCNIFSFKMSNPMCLPVDYSFTGPVTEIYRDNQEIIFQVNSGVTSGTVNLTASTAPEFNYIDDYSYTFNVISVSPPSPVILNPMSPPGTALQYVLGGQTYTCNVASITGASFEWEIIGGGITSGQGTNSITFVPDEYDIDNCPVIGRSNIQIDNVISGERNSFCYVLIKVKSKLGSCKSSASSIIFNYDISGCGGNIPCCTSPGQTCCEDCQWKFKVYPNPSSDQIKIEALDNKMSNIFNVEIIDILGNIKKSIKYSQGIGKVIIRTSDLRTGDYFIRIYDGSKWQISRLRVL